MKDELRNYLNRAKQYDNIDGTDEMLMGLMLLAFGLSSYMGSILPHNRFWNTIGGVLVMFGILIPAMAFGYWIRRVIKKRITWPRTGYAAFPHRGKTWRIKMALVCLISSIFSLGIVLLLAFATKHGGMNLFGLGWMTMFVAGYAVWIVRMGRVHAWKWFVLLLLALGVLAINLIVSDDIFEQMRPLMLFVGLMWLGSGGATLYLYIRHTKPATPEAE